MKRWKIIGSAFLAVGTAAFGIAQIDIGDIIKVGGIALLIDRFGKDINKGINKIQNFSDSQEMMTKVVPILSAGQGTHIGAAQVMGPPSLVKKVRAVAQVEGALFGKELRVRALIPVEAKDVSKIKRVVGVGVSAVLDLKV